VTFCLPKESVALLRRLSFERGTSMSAIVDLAIRELAAKSAERVT